VLVKDNDVGLDPTVEETDKDGTLGPQGMRSSTSHRRLDGGTGMGDLSGHWGIRDWRPLPIAAAMRLASTYRREQTAHFPTPNP